MDITELKNVEEELRQAKETFANSFNYSGIGKALIAPGGRWLEVNNTVCELTGYTKNELYDMHYNDITYPDDIGIDISLIQQLLAKQILSYSITKRYVTKDRNVLTTVITVTLVRDGNDQPLYFVCDILDETAKKSITDELLHKNQELETAAVNLLSKISQLEDLNHIIAHNLRGPASSIKMLSSQSEVFSNEEALEMIHASSTSPLENLDTMVEIARIKLDKEVTFDNCNVTAIINNITAQLQGVIYQKDARISINLRVKQISYPQIYLESILYNLISNSIKYRREDVPLIIEITTVGAGDRIVISLKDNGLGINMEKYGTRIFKLNQTFHHGYDSKGVGLLITKTQIESLGGTIEVRSKLNQGSEFIVTILKR